MKQKSLFLYSGLILSVAVFVTQSKQRTFLTVTSVSGQPVIQSGSFLHFHSVSPGSILTEKEEMVTDAQSAVDIKVSSEINVKLLPGSGLKGHGPRLYEKSKGYSLDLVRGSLLGAVDEYAVPRPDLKIQTIPQRIDTRDAVFGIFSEAGTERTWLGVLRGEIRIYDAVNPKGPLKVLRSLQKIEWSGAGIAGPEMTITLKDWQRMYEAYLLIPHLPDFEPRQKSLSGRAGNYFGLSYFNGSFYTPMKGFCDSVFHEEAQTGEAYLEINYDVFHPRGFVGFFSRMEALDLSRYQALEFEVRQKPKTGKTKRVHFEFKKYHSIIKSFVLEGVPSEWRKVSFSLEDVPKIPVDELVIFFNHREASETNQGAVQFRKVTLVRKETAPS